MADKPSKVRGPQQRAKKTARAKTRAVPADSGPDIPDPLLGAAEDGPDILKPVLAAAYENACDPDSDIGCPPTLKPLAAKLAPHSYGFPRVPAMLGLSKPTERRSRRFGWMPDLPDARDHVYSTPASLSVPPQFDLRDHYKPFPDVYDQEDLRSCTANAIAGAIQFERMRQRLPWAGQIPSRLFIYYNERVIEGSETEDRGAQLRDGIKSVVHAGTCFEGHSSGQWPYNTADFATEPPPNCYRMAVKDRVVRYSRLNQTFEQMRGCLALGYPFIFGFTVYESIRDADNGDIPLPSPNDTVVGGHAVMAVGYNDSTQKFTIRNSWGPDWGMRGYGTIPYAYLSNENLASDFWTIRLVSIPSK
jgi:C1A family cysteine protease